MIYWRIRQPGKSWRNWCDGVSDDINEAKRDALESLLDDDGNLQFSARVEMWKMTDTDDYTVDEEQVRLYRQNCLQQATAE